LLLLQPQWRTPLAFFRISFCAEAAPFDAASAAEAVLLDATDVFFDASSFPFLEMDVAKFFIDGGYGQ